MTGFSGSSALFCGPQHHLAGVAGTFREMEQRVDGDRLAHNRQVDKEQQLLKLTVSLNRAEPARWLDFNPKPFWVQSNNVTSPSQQIHSATQMQISQLE